MKRIYVAGPMRGIKNFNFPAFDLAANELRRAGWHVISPADIDRMFEPDFIPYPPEDFAPTETDFKNFIRRDLNLLLEFNPLRDAIYMLEGWENSKGGRVEKALAEFIGLQILYEID